MRVPFSLDPRAVHAWRRKSIGVALALAVALLPMAGFAAEDEDDFLSDDYSGEEFTDDFLEEDYVEQEEEVEKGFAYWAFYVPADLLISRPFALTDTAVGGFFLAASAPVLGVFGGASSVWDWAWGEGWYFDAGNFQAAMQICIEDPWAYAWDRPLGQLSSEY